MLHNLILLETTYNHDVFSILVSTCVLMYIGIELRFIENIKSPTGNQTTSSNKHRVYESMVKRNE